MTLVEAHWNIAGAFADSVIEFEEAAVSTVGPAGECLHDVDVFEQRCEVAAAEHILRFQYGSVVHMESATLNKFASHVSNFAIFVAPSDVTHTTGAFKQEVVLTTNLWRRRILVTGNVVRNPYDMPLGVRRDLPAGYTYKFPLWFRNPFRRHELDIRSIGARLRQGGSSPVLQHVKYEDPIRTSGGRREDHPLQLGATLEMSLTYFGMVRSVILLNISAQQNAWFSGDAPADLRAVTNFSLFQVPFTINATRDAPGWGSLPLELPGGVWVLNKLGAPPLDNESQARAVYNNGTMTPQEQFRERQRLQFGSPDDTGWVLKDGGWALAAIVTTLAVLLASAVVRWPPRGRRLRWKKREDGKPAKQLGRGSQGVVFRATFYGRFPQGEAVAVKGTAPGVDNARELDVLSRLTPHNNIVSYLGFEPHGPATLVVMELFSARTLDDYVRSSRVSVRYGYSVCKQIAHGVEFIHNNSIAHRDLKPTNVLVQYHRATATEPHVKLADFGMAKALTASRSCIRPSCLGTPGYQPREALECATAGDGRFNPKRADCFSMGVVFHQVLTGFHPFGTDLRRDGNIKDGMSTLLVDRDRAPGAHRLLEALLDDDPARRPSDAHACVLQFHHVFHQDLAGEMLCAQVRFWADFLGGGFEGHVDVPGERARLRERAGALSRAIEARLDADDRLAGTRHEWFRLVEPPDGTRPWRPQRSPETAYYRVWIGEGKRGQAFLQGSRPLPGFGLVKWVKDVFSHIGGMVNTGRFASAAAVEEWIAVAFPWLRVVLTEFAAAEEQDHEDQEETEERA